MAFEDIATNRYAGRPKPPIPLATITAVKKRAAGVCESCGERKPLELHHLHYETEGREQPEDLAAYCRTCHRDAHVDDAGEFWVDPAERENFWATYDNDN